MATVTYIKETKQHVSAMKAVMRYCQREDKTTDPKTGVRYVTGLNCNGANSFTEFLATKTAYNKLDGINFYQYVQSFSPNENVTYEQAHAIGLEFAAKAWPGHEVQVATHCDARHVHTHFVINSVSFETGMKLRQTPTTLRQLRQVSDEICMEHKLTVLPTYKRGGRKMSNREYRAARKGQSWKLRLMFHIGEAMKTSVNREDFIRQMQQRGYEVWWSDERKYITYTCPNGMKCRCNKLHYDKYLKENLEHEFEQRKQILAGFVYGGSGENERGSHGGAGRGSLPTHRLRSTQGMGGEWEDAAGERSAVSTHPVQPNLDPGNPEGSAGCGVGSEGRAESGEAGTGGENKRPEGTGWEREREYFYLHVRGAHHRRERNQERIRSTADEKKPAYVDHDLGLGGTVGAGIRAVSALGRLTEEDESDDPEEQKRKHEAQQAADNVGAVLGLAIGAIEAFTRNNQSLARTQDEEQQIEEEEEFNEFLASLDEEYAYEEQQQMM
ncbi:relaxase/mobilization nuclease domain-containing protein [Succinimonas sp.]|uniref:relaxase/mobilization nuclease domain-containing protein n=1 Tax=Succinimonas sp. TaxID=1936151 RepID=UPI003864DCF2